MDTKDMKEANELLKIAKEVIAEKTYGSIDEIMNDYGVDEFFQLGDGKVGVKDKRSKMYHWFKFQSGVYRLSGTTIRSQGATRHLSAKEVIASMQRYCGFFQAVDGNWYMDLANREYAEYEEATTYGPFPSLDVAIQYLDDNFSNPGGWMEGTKKQPVPHRSPNGSPVQRPRSRGWRL